VVQVSSGNCVLSPQSEWAGNRIVPLLNERTEIKEQWYDWGYNKQLHEGIFANPENFINGAVNYDMKEINWVRWFANPRQYGNRKFVREKKNGSCTEDQQGTERSGKQRIQIVAGSQVFEDDHHGQPEDYQQHYPIGFLIRWNVRPGIQVDGQDHWKAEQQQIEKINVSPVQVNKFQGIAETRWQ